MPEQFLPFHSFPDAELVNDFAEKLSGANIDFEIENVPSILADNIIGTSSAAGVIIKLRSKDFEKAHEALGDYYKMQLEFIDKEHYLFAFTDHELYEILEKPDEWGYLDYQLASKILNDRGKAVDSLTLQNLKKERIKELAKPGKASRSLIMMGYCFFFFAGIPTILIGRYILKDQKTLPDGQVVSSFTEGDKRHANRMIAIGIIFLCFIILLLIAQLLFPAKAE
jgi:hypothetical protein